MQMKTKQNLSPVELYQKLREGKELSRGNLKLEFCAGEFICDGGYGCFPVTREKVLQGIQNGDWAYYA